MWWLSPAPKKKSVAFRTKKPMEIQHEIHQFNAKKSHRIHRERYPMTRQIHPVLRDDDAGSPEIPHPRPTCQIRCVHLPAASYVDPRSDNAEKQGEHMTK